MSSERWSRSRRNWSKCSLASTISGYCNPWRMIRDSRYFGSCLRSKNATGWLHGEREPTSIEQARRRLVHPFAKHRQVSIEHAVIERSELNLNVCGVLRNRAGEMKKRQQTSPGSLGIGCGKVAITRPHRQIRQSHFEDRHRVIFPAI